MDDPQSQGPGPHILFFKNVGNVFNLFLVNGYKESTACSAWLFYIKVMPFTVGTWDLEGLGRAGQSMDLQAPSSSASSSLAPSSSRAGAAPPPPPNRQDFRNVATTNRRLKLDEIESSLKHKLTLCDWKDQLTAANDNLSRKLSSRNSSTSDLYQILGLFFVFEGVVITAVAQATAIKCRYSWLIFTLSLLATAATFFACIQKLREIAEGKRMYLEERAVCSALHNSIDDLKEAGINKGFNLEKNQPEFSSNNTNHPNFWKTWVWSYTGGVIFVLLAFSGVTLATVHLIVCDPRRNLADP